MDETTLPSKDPSDRIVHQRRELAVRLQEALRRVKALEEERHTDPLTGISNQRAFIEKFGPLVEEANANSEPLALLLADVDGLKRVNDKLGHSEGDRLLRIIGGAFSDVARPTDLVGRLGGDEFYAVLPGFSPMPGQNLEDLFFATATRYREAFDKAVAGSGLSSDLHVGVSFGMSILYPGESADTLYERADAKAIASKKMMYEHLGSKGIRLSDKRASV